MKPADLRNATWHEVQAHLTDDLQRVHAAILAHGPGTTRQLSDRSGISIFTLRPRTTDLGKFGLVELIGRSGEKGTEGVYAARTLATAETDWTAGRRPKFDADDTPLPTAPSRAVNTLSFKDELLSQIARLPLPDQLSIAGAIRARAGHQARHIPSPAQTELFAS